MEAPKDKDSIIARFREGPDLLDRTLAGVSEADLDTPPSQGGWTIRQIVHHLADGDDIWKLFIKAALGDGKAAFSLEWYQEYPQDVWVDHWAYANRPLDVSLALLKASRDQVLQLLEQVPDVWHKSANFREPNGETERVPVGFAIKMQADHIEHHVKRILAIRDEIGGA